MKRFLLLLSFTTLLTLAAPADQQIQSVQQALKDQGFYYGQVDGQPGPETDAAVRRYQIRQGLDVTGKIDEQTLDSLSLGDKSSKPTVEAVAPAAQDNTTDNSQPAAGEATPAPKSVVQSDHDFLSHHTQATPAPPPADDDSAAPPPVAQPVQPPPPPAVAQGQTLPPEYAYFFRKTPYETAPPVVQRTTIQRAQVRLARQGFYAGVVDGELSKSFTRAIVAYQRDADLSATGRLDMDTLSDMNLLPQRRVVVHTAIPVPAPPVVYGRDVYRGIWVH